MSGDFGAVSNFLPGEPGKYVTILDLKERWMKNKQEEEEEEHKKACQRLDALKIGSEEDRFEGRFVGAGNSRLRSGGVWRGRGRGRAVRSEWSDIGGSNSQTNERKGGDGKCELVSVLDFEKSVYKKKGLVEDDVVGNYNVKFGGRGSRGWYSSGKRFSQDGNNAKGIVSGVTENVDVDIEEKREEVVSVGKEKGTRTNCPCHSKTENQGDGGFWVCKYVEPALRDEIGQSVTVNEAAKGDMDHNEMKKNGRMEEVELLKKHQRPRKVREEMTMERGKEDGKRMTGDFSRVVNYHGMTRKSWQAGRNWEMAKGVKDEETTKQMQKEEVAYNISRRVVNHEGSCQKNDVELQLYSVEPPDEIEDHSEASSVAERETMRRGKFRTMDGPFDDRKIYDSGRFKAEKNFGALPIDYVMKDSMKVNNCCKKVINQVDSRVINDLAPKLENTEPMDSTEKSDAPLLAEMVENSSARFRDTRNRVHQRKTSVNKRLQTERRFPNMGITNSGKFNGRMSAMRNEKNGLMWVKKGEAPPDNTGRKN